MSDGPAAGSGAPAVPARRTVPAGLAAALLVAIAAAVWAPGLDNDFVGDDFEWARFGLQVRESPQRVFSVFSGFVTPAMNVTVGLDAAASGTAPWSYNLTGLLFHLLNIALIRRLLAAATGSRSASWLVALWWGVHYRHDEAVLWLGGRPHVLVITGVLAALLLQRRWLRTGAAADLALATGAALFAILSKESGVMVVPIAAAWTLLIEPRRPGLTTARRWAAPALGALLAAAHGAVLIAVREDHQFYYRLDLSWIGRLGAVTLAPIGLTAPDPAPWWWILPAIAIAAALAVRGEAAVRFGLLSMLLGTLPTVLIEFQPPRYRYFPLAGAAFVLAGLAAPLMRRPRLRAATAGALALSIAWLAVGVRNDEAFLDEAGRIHRDLLDGFCAAATGVDAARPLVVAWSPSLLGVEALREAANRPLALEIRNYPPIYVRANGLEGIAEPETLWALCLGGARGASVRRLDETAAAGAILGSEFAAIGYDGARFERLGAEALEGIQALARREGRLPFALAGGRRVAALLAGG